MPSSSLPRRAWSWLVCTAAGLAIVVTSGGAAGTALVVDAPLASPSAIVALGSHEWERLPEAVAMAKRFPAATVLLTQPAELNAYNCHDCSARTGTLVKAGIPRSRIVLLPRRVRNTFDEALAVHEWVRRAHARSVLVVTSPYHTRRALATFRHVFGDSGTLVGVRPARAYSNADPAHWWRSKHDRWYVAYEWRALLFYTVRHGVWPMP